jgi:hypothetical protein
MGTAFVRWLGMDFGFRMPDAIIHELVGVVLHRHVPGRGATQSTGLGSRIPTAAVLICKSALVARKDLQLTATTCCFCIE